MQRLIAAAMALSLNVAGTEAAEHTEEPLSTVKQHVDNKAAVLVDVREQSEWDAGHVQGAIFLPLSAVRSGQIPADIVEQLPKDKVLYPYCVVGRRALTVGDLLERQGYTVKVLKPGYRELVAAGFPSAR